MDEFIEEHSQRYEFRERHSPPQPPQPASRRPHPPGSSGSGSGQGLEARGEEDRYVLIFQALRKELCRMTWPPLDGKTPSSRPRTLRVLQCLRLLTRDPELQAALFEPPPASRRGERAGPAGERGRERDREALPTPPAPPAPSAPQAPQTARGRGEKPAAAGRAAPHPPPASTPRLGVSASPRRAGCRASAQEAAAAAAAGYGSGGSVPASGSREPRRCRSVGTSEELRVPGAAAAVAAREAPEAEREHGVRLPPLDAPSRTLGSGFSEVGGAAPAASALLRLLSELVAEYLAEDGELQAAHAADACAGAGRGARLGIAVAGLCIAEIVGILNRYASTEARRSRLAQIGALRPLACLLSGVSDPLVLRCALEALVHFTLRRNTAVLAELAQLSLPDAERDPCVPQALRGCPSGGSWPASVLRECLHLLSCGEELYEGLAAQLLEQLLESPELRAQLRRLQGVGTVVGHLSPGPPEAGRQREPGCGAGAARRKTVHMLRCCQKLARDLLERGDPAAVHELLAHGALEAALPLLRLPPRGPSEASGQQQHAELLLACLDALAQMCMDDECATALRLEHAPCLGSLGALLLGDGARRKGSRGEAGRAPTAATTFTLQCAAARLLRFIFAVERNRKALKHILPMEVLEPFLDAGSYAWPLEAYEPFVRAVCALGEREACLLRGNFQRPSNRAPTAQRFDWHRRPSGEGLSPQPSEPSTPSNSTVCGYELLECVGSGAFGRVFLARRGDRPGDIALKEVPLTSAPEPSAWEPAAAAAAGPRRDGRCGTPRGPEDFGESTPAHEQAAKEISEEVRLLRQLDHPNIVQYYSSFTTSSGGATTLWIAMEFCSGSSLQVLAASAREKGLAKLPEEQTWRIFAQLCLALRYLHVEKGIAHRDLTPNNVLVQSRTLAAKLADFGLARQKHGAGTAAASMMKSMVGTILYSCPEIVQQRPYTHRTDIWALGCLLYKMATLRDPFQGNNPLSVARRIVECEYERLDEARHSEMLVQTCCACLTVSPEGRPDIQQVCQMVTPALIQHLEAVQRAASATQRPQRSCAPEPPASWRGESPGTSPARRRLLAAGTPSPAPEDGAFPSPGPLTKALFEDPLQLTPLAAAPAQPAQLHRRAPRAAPDPTEKALLVAHRLAYAAQLPLAGEGEEDLGRLAVDRYQRWLFGCPHNAAILKREVSRLMQRSQEPVECPAFGGEGAAALAGVADVHSGTSSPVLLPQLTYEVLYGHLLEVCSQHGYDGSAARGAESGSG